MIVHPSNLPSSQPRNTLEVAVVAVAFVVAHSSLNPPETVILSAAEGTAVAFALVVAVAVALVVACSSQPQPTKKLSS
jgi:hypothetical protein